MPTAPPQPIDGDPWLELLRQPYIGPPASVMYRRAVFDDVGGFDSSPRFKGSEDYELYFRVVLDHPICCHNEVVAEYRRHGANMSRDPALMLPSWMAVLRAQGKHLVGRVRYRKAYRAGVRDGQRKYGEPLVDAVLGDLLERRWTRVLSGIAALLRDYPHGLTSLLGAVARDLG
jgi:hypothetical protein